MAPTALTGDALVFLTAAGWRQFFLDEQFAISPPTTLLAELCKVPPDTLEGLPFLNLFFPPDQEELHHHLVELSITPDQPICSMPLVLQWGCHHHTPVEIMLFPDHIQDTRGRYVGFIRSLPKNIINFSKEYTVDQPDPTNKPFDTFVRLAYDLVNVLDLEILLNRTVESLSQNIEQICASILLVNDDETTLSLKAISGVSIETLSSNYLNFRIDRQTVVGRAVITAKPVQISRMSPQDFEALGYLPIDTQSELAIPLVFAGQVLGVLDIQSDAPNRFADEEIVLLQTVAHQLALAIENVRLFDERDRRIAELAVFNQIGMAIVGRQDLHSMLSGILRRVSALFQVEGVSLMLLEEDGLHFAVALGSAADEIKSFVLKPGQGIAWSVVDTRQTIRVDHVESDPRHFSAIDSAVDFKTRSLLAVPVQIQNRVLGVIEVMNRLDGRPFSRDNEATLEFIASAIAVVIENARLFQETQEKLKALTTLTQASSVITRAPDLDQLLEIVLELSLSIVQAEVGAIIFSEGPIATLRIKAARGFDWERIELFNQLKISQYVGIWGETYRTKQIIEITDGATDPRVFTSPEVAWIFPNSFACVPLLTQEECIGIVILRSLPDNQEIRALLKAVADMAAVAIGKARLFQETNQWLAEVLTLYTLADQLTKILDVNHIVDSGVSILKHALDCGSCCLFLKEQTGDEVCLVLKATNGLHEDNQESPEIEYIANLANKLLGDPQPIHIENISRPQSSRTPLPEFTLDMKKIETWQPEIKTRSVMIVPLIVKGEVIGALSIADTRPNAFTQSEDRVLTVAAAQISTAIENIRLYDDLEQRMVELELALEEVQEANRLKSEFVQNVSHELRTPLTFVRAYVELILEGSMGEVPELVSEKLRIVSEKSQAITRLVEDVVFLQKIESGNLKFEATTPHELVTRARYGAVASAAQHNIEIVSKSPAKLPPVWVDIDRIGQVFDNLMDNAIKFSPEGGKISIRIEQKGDFISFSVQDNGIGIPADKLDKVFERFYQVDGSTTRRYRGTGLGLAIVKEIVEAHRGQVAVESVVNASTTFSFTLPIYHGEVDSESV